jgi:hypothetical protein
MDILVTEAGLAIKDGVRLAIDLGYQNVEVESGMEEFIKLIEETRW